MDALTSTHIAAWLACAFFMMGMVKAALGLVDRFKETPAPSQTYVAKADCAQLHQQRAADLSQLTTGLGELRLRQEEQRKDSLALVDRLRAETKADIVAIYGELRELRSMVSQMIGEMKHVNTSLVQLEQRLQDRSDS